MKKKESSTTQGTKSTASKPEKIVLDKNSLTSSMSRGKVEPDR